MTTTQALDALEYALTKKVYDKLFKEIPIGTRFKLKYRCGDKFSVVNKDEAFRKEKRFEGCEAIHINGINVGRWTEIDGTCAVEVL